MKVAATYNIKGGVGKTSAAVNLAALAARSGLRTLLWDLDPQGSATYLLRVKPKVKGGVESLVRRRGDVEELLRGTDVEGLDLLPADFSYRHMDLLLGDTKRPESRLAKILSPLSGSYDLALLDCAPSISLVSQSVFDVADGLLVPLVPATLSVRTFDQLRRVLAEEVAEPPEVIAFFSMVDRRKRLHREIVDQLGGADPDVARASVPAASEIERMGATREPLVVTSPRSAASRAYGELWAEIASRLGLAQPDPGA